jgi:hypothetical protein
MKGGARVNSGPPPDPNAIRRGRQGDADTWTYLPTDGFTGAIPDWPLLDDVTLTARRDMLLEKAGALADQLADEDDAKARGRIQGQLDSANQRIRVLDQQIDAQRDLEQAMWGDLWKPDQYVVDFPTLWVVPEWIEAALRHPGRLQQGRPFRMYDWQLWCTVNHYRVKPTAKVGQLSPAFHYRRSAGGGAAEDRQGPVVGDDHLRRGVRAGRVRRVGDRQGDGLPVRRSRLSLRLGVPVRAG